MTRPTAAHLSQLLTDRAEDFADLESLEVGKARIEPRVIDLPQAVGTVRHYAGWADKLTGHSIPTPGYAGRATLSYTIREPIGVVAAITPWNSSTMIGTWKLAPALAAGCAVVLKPPEDAPLTSLLLAQLAEQATLELGGKSPQIMFADADPDAAAHGLALGTFGCRRPDRDAAATVASWAGPASRPIPRSKPSPSSSETDRTEPHRKAPRRTTHPPPGQALLEPHSS